MQKDDVIYRQDAIDAVNDCGICIQKIVDLPSAQPTQTNADSTHDNTLDCVSRQQAIDAVVSAMIDGADAELVEGIMELLPSAQPERKKGKWIPVTNGRGGFECNQCHCYAPSYQDGVEWLSAFCPNCGCRMEGESE